jgi:hypothetical protein
MQGRISTLNNALTFKEEKDKLAQKSHSFLENFFPESEANIVLNIM